METSAKKTKYTFSFKIKIIQFAEQKGKHAAAKLFKIDRKRVRERVRKDYQVGIDLSVIRKLTINWWHGFVKNEMLVFCSCYRKGHASGGIKTA